jgi:hypothetical protein
MDWNEYRKLLDQKISDAWHNYEYAEKKFNEAKAKYEAVMLEKQSFEKSLDNLVGEK